MSKYVLAEFLKEQLRGRRVRAAVFHTFNFDSEFFENYLLPLFLPEIPFGENKIQNTILWKKFQHDLPPVTVYCDFHAKAQRGIHLNYIVRTIDVPSVNGFKPCYHVKHTYILTEDYELLIITGSNNLTEAGWCSNLEGINFFKLKPNENFPREFKDGLKYFNRRIREHYFSERFDDENSRSVADNIIDRFFRSQGYTSESEVFYFDTSSKGISQLQNFNQLISNIKLNLNENKPFEKIEVVSPYYSRGISLFEKLTEVSECDDISFSIPFENSGIVGMEGDLFRKVEEKGFQWKSIIEINKTRGFRFNHSKIYQLVGQESVFIIVGSVNFTEMAWKGVSEGGNYESAIVYKHPKAQFIPLLEYCSTDDFIFSGKKDIEGITDHREDVFNLEFVIDWNLGILEILNHDEANQNGKIEFENIQGISIKESRDVKLSSQQIDYLSNFPIIKVKPAYKSTFFYYYPIHKNIEFKPLPANINLSDSELLQLWMELDETKNVSLSLQIIESYVDRITNEAGDVQEELINRSPSTLNIMATHLNGLLKLEARVFHTGRNKKEEESIKKMRDYYLFANNVDTLIGYRKLLVKMAEEEKLNNGFYWFLLNYLDMFFYKPFLKKFAKNIEDKSKVEAIRKKLKSEINDIKKRILDGKLKEKHLKWTLKMMENDIN